MFNPAGAVTSWHAHETVALKTVRGPNGSIAAGQSDMPIMVVNDYDVGIWSIYGLPGVGNNTAPGSISVGTVAAPTSIVNAHSVNSNDVGPWNTGVAPQALTLASTLVDTNPKHFAKPIVPAGTAIVFSTSGTNAFTFWLQVRYFLVQPGV